MSLIDDILKLPAYDTDDAYGAQVEMRRRAALVCVRALNVLQDLADAVDAILAWYPEPVFDAVAGKGRQPELIRLRKRVTDARALLAALPDPSPFEMKE